MIKWLLGIAVSLSCSSLLSIKPPKLPPAREFSCLVENVYHEARGEPIHGQYAVVWVTMARAKTYNNICKTVWKRKQFSWTSQKVKKLSNSDWLTTANTVYEALQLRDTLNATHYHNKKVNPKWKLKRVAIIGNHIFYY